MFTPLSPSQLSARSTAAQKSTSFSFPSSAVSASNRQQNNLSSLNLDTYISIKHSLVVDVQCQIQQDLKREIAKQKSSGGSAETSKALKKRTRANAAKNASEVQSLRAEQNETMARREQLREWVNWLRV